MTANTPENTDEPTPGAVPPPPPGDAVPSPPAPGYGPPQGAYPPPAYGAPQGAYPPPAYGVGAPLSDSDQRMWAVLSHIGTLLFEFLAPLVIWLVFKGRGAFSEDQAKESLNFQITAAIGAAALGIFTVITLGFGVFLYFPFGIAFVVFVVIAAVKAGQGVAYRYPLTIRFIK